MAAVVGVQRLLPAWLPKGHRLPDSVWRARHSWVMGVVIVQAAALVPFALIQGFSLGHALIEAAVPAAMAVLASLRRLPKVTRASLASVGLMLESGIAVHLSGGVIEAHFHFFVMVPIVALYESWVPFGLAVGYVLFQHGIVGAIDSSEVYNHESAREHPWLWAGIHAVLFGAACLGSLVNWTMHERARQVTDELTEATERDTLTQLPNRTGLQRLGQEAIGSGGPLSVLLIDLDGFKDVNDTLGHAGGDVLLQHVAARLASGVGLHAVLGRLGGDEFVVVLPGFGESAAQSLADQLRAGLREGFTVEGMSFGIGSSVGIASWTPSRSQSHDGNAEVMTELLRKADVAMYAAKQSRRGTAAYEIGLDHEARRRLTFITELRRAIVEDQLVVHFQPKVCLPSGEPCGFEALVRWDHPERGLIAPADFMATAEKTTYIDQLTATVLDKALTAVRQWHDAGMLLGVSVNVSPYSLTDQLVQVVDRALRVHHLDGAWLCLEITEELFIVDDAAAQSVLRDLKQRGITISIDDFGSGYSSMSYLQRLPADELKIDRSLVSGLRPQLPARVPPHRAQDDYGLVIVTSTIEMAHSLGLRVVAEGVDNTETLALLISAGCDQAQGYLIARPMPSEAVLSWLAASGCLTRSHQLDAS